METITRNNHRLEVQAVHGDIGAYPEKYIYCYGGRGGGKSKTVARLVPAHCWENPGLISLVTRKTFPSLKITAMKDTLNAIEQMGIPGTFYKSDSYFQYINGSITYFLPLYTSTGGKNERLKSLDLNIVWIEEPTECTQQDFDYLNPSVRLPGLHKFYFTFNPPETSDHWIYKKYDIQKSKGMAQRVHFSLEDNPLLPDDIKQELYDLKETDEGLYLRFAKGEWGIDVLRERVWENVHRGVLRNEPTNIFGGIDHGYTAPACAYIYGLYDNDIYIIDEVYKRKMQPEEFGFRIIEMLKRNHIRPNSIPFHADSEDPKTNDKLKDFRWENKSYSLWIIPAKKGKGSVKASLKEVRSYKVLIDEEKCPNAWREIPYWIFPKDRDGNISEEPLGINDHSCMALCYGVMGQLKGKIQLYVV